MRRREFIAGVIGAVAWPRDAFAQKQSVHTIGVLGSPTAASFADRFARFRTALKVRGLIEGENLKIEARWADDNYGRLPGLATELMSSGVALVVTFGNRLSAAAAKNASSTIPVVFVIGADPVQVGLVASLNKPGGNLTGIASQGADLTPKRIDLLHDAIPNARAIGFLTNPDNFGPNSSAGRSSVESAQDSVRAWGGTIHPASTRSETEFDAAFASLARIRVDAIATGADQIFASGRERLVALAAKHSLPMIHTLTETVQAGGFMSYGASFTEIMDRAAEYVERILGGESPSNLPVQLSTKFELAINLKTAKALGITVPPTLLARADEVIE